MTDSSSLSLPQYRPTKRCDIVSQLIQHAAVVVRSDWRRLEISNDPTFATFVGRRITLDPGRAI